MSLGDAVLPFLILLGVLIFIHELGHFLVAKWCDVKVEKFSLGFGPVLLRKRVGETEYAISALPLGGFVKMLGEIPGEELAVEERARAFNHKPPWQRIAIAVAGPAMNFALPVVLFACVAMLAGLPERTTRVGAVLPGSAAAEAGVRPGDRIVAVEGEPIELWRELTRALGDSEAVPVSVTVERGGERVELALERERAAGGLGPIGVQAMGQAAVIAVPDPASPAGRAGLETGDRIVAVAGREIHDVYALETELARAELPVEVAVTRPAGKATEQRTLELAPPLPDRGLEALGIWPVDFAIVQVSPATPARQAGIEAGDIIARIDDRPIRSRDELIEVIRASEGRELEIVLLRGGERIETRLSPQRAPIPMPDGSIETHYSIGVAPAPITVGGEIHFLTERNPIAALWLGTTTTVRMTGGMLRGLWEMLRGNVGLGSVAGPIGIGQLAADSFQSSWREFIQLMALISVNLAILNLLPIPVLDGGTIVLTLAEWARGGPLPDRARDWAQAVGLSFILVLMGFAFWNDISRNWEGIVGFFRGLV